MSTSIYWIHHKDHTDVFSRGYIGVSKNTEARFKRHGKYSEARKVKVKYQEITYNSFEDLAKHLNIKYSTLTNRIYRNAAKYGYEVLK